jgi:hypothetical protein
MPLAKIVEGIEGLLKGGHLEKIGDPYRAVLK